MHHPVGRVIPLVKLAADSPPKGYRPIAATGEFLDEKIPYVGKVTGRQLKNFDTWLAGEVKASPGRVLRHQTVALKDESVPDLERLGFRKTRLAVPLPGEKGILPVSYRKGNLHVHDMGETLLAHRDRVAPEGFLASLHHGVVEGIPAYMRRLRAKKPIYQTEGSP